MHAVNAGVWALAYIAARPRVSPCRARPASGAAQSGGRVPAIVSNWTRCLRAIATITGSVPMRAW